MKKYEIAIVAGLVGVAALAGAACDSDNPVPPTPIIQATTLPQPTRAAITATAETTRVVSLPSPTVAQSVWQLFTSAEGRFSVLMPGEPVRDSRPINDALGNLTLKSFAAEDGTATYTLFFIDFPDTVQKTNPSDLLNAALTRVEGSNTVTEQKKITVQGNPGVQVEGENGTKGYMRYMAVLAKSRLYELVVLTPNSTDSAAKAGRFLDSFKLTSQ